MWSLCMEKQKQKWTDCLWEVTNGKEQGKRIHEKNIGIGYKKLFNFSTAWVVSSSEINDELILAHKTIQRFDSIIMSSSGN